MTANTLLTDVNGKRLPAMHVFSGVIAYLKEHLKSRLQGMDNKSHIPDSSIHWVLTVPAIWNDKSKQFMRKAAQKVTLHLYNPWYQNYQKHFRIKIVLSANNNLYLACHLLLFRIFVIYNI